MRSFQAILLCAGLNLGIGSAATGAIEGPEGAQAASEPAAAQSVPASQPGNEGYTIFNPTPSGQMRSFSPDRPSVTEGPFTVDPGHLQAELSFVEYTYDYDQGSRTDAFSVVPVNVRVGILSDLEFDFIVNPYLNTLTHSQTMSSRLSGFGDTELRAKLNLWGNDGGVTAFGLLPFVNFPTAYDGLSDHHVEGGLILPFAAQLPADFALGAMAEFDVDRNAANDGYGVDIVHSITVGHGLTEKLAAYIEYVGIAPVQTGRTYLAYFDWGVTYLLGANLQIDAGINVGLSRHADDFTIVTGLSFRI